MALAIDLYGIFGKYGRLLDVFIPFRPSTIHPRGYAFVWFRYEQDARAARDILNGRRIDGRVVAVHFAKPRGKPIVTPQNQREGTPLVPSFSFSQASFADKVNLSKPAPPQKSHTGTTIVADPVTVSRKTKELKMGFIGLLTDPRASISN
ncbi:serine/arginine-rich splicing factor SC35-like [Magnolia sinica]|uniref:serine/arginine-rich splicing factor SC35-like n=1 Tax=Magnolia sinica TaxID=86752 RepID=UPI002658F219|nr:serine/arginine-rich splicing factor SC35-like [Magnolia sinica]